MKMILTDLDGVCFNWLDPFLEWVVDVKGLVDTGSFTHDYHLHSRFNIPPSLSLKLADEFNRSEYCSRLPAQGDAVKYITKLKQKGYEFHGFTAMGTEKIMQDNRWMNVYEHFGDAFKKIHFFGHDTCKSSVFKQKPYKNIDAFWIEDLERHATVGLQHGYKSLLMDQDWNRDCDHPDIRRVSSWSDIYKIIRNK